MSDVLYKLFSTPVMESDLGREFTAEEMQFALDQKNDLVPNSFNTRSRNSKVLDEPVLADIKSFIEERINFYFRNVMVVDESVKIHITQSWFNYTEPGQSHHQHCHGNSIVSGVIYFDTQDDKLTFHREHFLLRNQLVLPAAQWNEYNCESWWLPATKGHALFFPSFVQHSVMETHNSKTRISLAFNTFITGTLGSEYTTTELVVK